MRILRRIAEATGLPVITDVHQAADCERVAEAVDVLQIPAFLCRQTDLLLAAARTGRAVNIKKGQFVAPWDMSYAVDKVTGAGNPRVFLTERGFSFGYNNLVVDMRSLAIMRKIAPVVFDGTHSVQTPSSAGGQSGGQPEFIPVLARAAVAAGVDGLFLEVHDDPANAKSDGANALNLKDLRPLLESLLAIHGASAKKPVAQAPDFWLNYGAIWPYTKVTKSAYTWSNLQVLCGSKKRAPRVRGQSALVLSLCESFYAALVLGLRRSIPGGGLRVRLLRRAYW